MKNPRNLEEINKLMDNIKLSKFFKEGKIPNPDDDKYYNVKFMKKLIGVKK